MWPPILRCAPGISARKPLWRERWIIWWCWIRNALISATWMIGTACAWSATGAWSTCSARWAGAYPAVMPCPEAARGLRRWQAKPIMVWLGQRRARRPKPKTMWHKSKRKTRCGAMSPRLMPHRASRCRQMGLIGRGMSCVATQILGWSSFPACTTVARCCPHGETCAPGFPGKLRAGLSSRTGKDK